jgi:nicotinamide-nucleotide amidase
VPFEMQPMFEKQVIPYLKKNFKLTSCLYSKIVKIVGLPESAVNARVKDLLKLKPPLTVGIYAHAGEIDLRINAKAASEKGAAKMMAPVIGKIQKRFAINVSSLDGEPLEKIVGELLARQKKTLAVAESCTGGLISSRLTDMSGSSRYFLMGEIVYSNRIKIERLGISPELLKKSGAVSSLVALRLAENIRKIAKSDFGLSASGIAGPSGATKTKPVGLVYIGFSSKNKTYAKEFHFLGNRTQIKYKTSQAALDMLRRELIS